MPREEFLERIGKLSDDELEILAEAVGKGFISVYDPAIDEDEAIARLGGDERFIAFQRVVRTSRDKWMQNFAKGLAQSRNLIDQREVDEKRGYWYGAMFFTHVLPRIAQRKVARAARERSDA